MIHSKQARRVLLPTLRRYYPHCLKANGGGMIRIVQNWYEEFRGRD